MSRAIATVLAVAAAGLPAAGCGEAAPERQDAPAVPATVAAAGATTVAATTAAPAAPSTTADAPPPAEAPAPAAAETVPRSSATAAEDRKRFKLPAGARAPSADAIRAQLKRAAEQSAAQTRKAGRSAFGPPATPAQERAVRAVFDAVVVAVGAQDWAAACDLLLPAMRAQYATPDGRDGCPAAVRQYVRQRGTADLALRDLRVKRENATGLNDQGATVVFVNERGRWYLASTL